MFGFVVVILWVIFILEYQTRQKSWILDNLIGVNMYITSCWVIYSIFKWNFQENINTKSKAGIDKLNFPAINHKKEDWVKIFFRKEPYGTCQYYYDVSSVNKASFQYDSNLKKEMPIIRVNVKQKWSNNIYTLFCPATIRIYSKEAMFERIDSCTDFECTHIAKTTTDGCHYRHYQNDILETLVNNIFPNSTKNYSIINTNAINSTQFMNNTPEKRLSPTQKLIKEEIESYGEIKTDFKTSRSDLYRTIRLIYPLWNEDKIEKIINSFFKTTQSPKKLVTQIANNKTTNLTRQSKVINKLNKTQSTSKVYTENDINNMHWRTFEKFIATIFNNLGYTAKTTVATNDQGKDIIAIKNDVVYFIECKHWKSSNSIGREYLQKLVGAAVGSGVKNVIFVTTGKYSKNAIEYASNKKSIVDIQLWSMQDILKHANDNTVP